MIRRTILALVASTVVAALAAPTAQAVRPTLTPAGVSAFGVSSYVLTLPHGAKVPADATLTEDGREVKDVAVTPVTGVPGSYGVALLIDGSSQRAGKAIQGQLAAARAFLAERPDSLPVAIITYNAAATVAAPFTTERKALQQAVAAPPPLGRGVHVYDAAQAALDLFDAEGLGGGAIIALAGASDDGSSVTAKAVTERALKAGVWVFGASLAAGRPARPTIDELTPDGVGQNLGEMSGPGLVALLRTLGKQTGAASVLSYPAMGAPGTRVSVEFQAATRSVRTSTLLPRRAVTTNGAPPRRPDVATPFAQTPAGRGLVSVAVVVLLFGGFAPVLLSFRRRRDMRRRVASYASDAPAPVTASAIEMATDAARDSQLLGGDRMRRLAVTLDLAKIETTPGQLVLRTLVAAVLAGYLVGSISGIPLAGVASMIGVPFLVRAFVNFKLGRQRKLFADQLADALQAAASAMRGGHSFVGALATIVDEAPEPTATEFGRVVAAERIGIPLDQSFGEMMARMDNRDVRQVALVAQLQRETGGNAAEAVDRVVENLRGRDDVRRLVGTLTAQGRMSRWVLTGMPIGIGVMLTMLNGEYMAPLFETNIGRVLLAIGGIMCALGSMAIGKIVDIEV